MENARANAWSTEFMRALREGDAPRPTIQDVAPSVGCG